MYFISNLFNHLRHFHAAALRLQAQGEFQLTSLHATVRVGNRSVPFLAQFLASRPDGSVTYSMELGPDSTAFVGWLPYFNKRWVEAYDKLAFRQRCQQAGLPLPRASAVLPAPDLGDFVVKRARGSSFGYGVRGPYAAHEAATLRLAPGEYAEEYVHGEVGKAWYWNDRVVAIELREPAHVVGDGTTPLGPLVQRGRRLADITQPTAYMRYRGMQWSDIPTAGEVVRVDYKYGSDYERFVLQSFNRMDELQDSAVVAQLNRWGHVFWGFVPPHIRAGTLYTVDFVAPADGTLRLLEMNCNPRVPPEVYDTLLAAAFGAPGEISLTGTEHTLLGRPASAAAAPPPAMDLAAAAALSGGDAPPPPHDMPRSQRP